jgi:hypothetical protein
LLEFFKFNENTTEKIDDDEIECEEWELELLDFNANDDTLISQSEVQSLNYLLGSILLKIKNNFKSCNDCLSSVITHNVDDDDSIKDLKNWSILNAIKKKYVLLEFGNFTLLVLPCVVLYRASHIRVISEFILYATKNTNDADYLIPFIM